VTIVDDKLGEKREQLEEEKDVALRELKVELHEAKSRNLYLCGLVEELQKYRLID